MELIEVRLKQTHDAVQLSEDNIIDVAKWIEAETEDINTEAGTLEVMIGGGDFQDASFGDWIVKDSEDELWVFTDKEFNEEYVKVPVSQRF